MKRFTETNKWRDPWFMELSLQAKAVFGYITDNCDNSGVWDPTKRLVNFCLKCDVDWDSVVAEFGNRIAILPSGKWWITRFCQFQYGQLNPNCPPHRSVIEQARKNGLVVDENGNVTLELPLSKGSEKDKEKDKEKDRDRGPGEGSQADLFSDQPPAPPPAAPSSPTFASPPPDHPPAKNPLQRRAEKLFKRRESTVWDGSERRAWEKSRAAITATSEEDWALLEWFYALHPKTEPPLYRRHDLAQLLNNWGAEIDRAQAYRTANPCPKAPAAPSVASDIYTEPPDWRERAAARWPGVTLPEKWTELSASARNDLLLPLPPKK